MKKIIKNCLMLSILCSTFVLLSCNTAKKEECKKSGEATSENAEGSCCSKGEGECCKKDMLVIVAHVTAYPEHKDELLKAFEAVVAGTHTEEGNISYDLYEDVSNPLKFTFIEYWKSNEAIEAHNASAHFQEFAQKISGKADLDVSILKHKF